MPLRLKNAPDISKIYRQISKRTTHRCVTRVFRSPYRDIRHAWKTSKCRSGCHPVKYLDHLITKHGLLTNPDKIKVVRETVERKTSNISSRLYKQLLGVVSLYPISRKLPVRWRNWLERIKPFIGILLRRKPLKTKRTTSFSSNIASGPHHILQLMHRFQQLRFESGLVARRKNKWKIGRIC